MTRPTYSETESAFLCFEFQIFKSKSLKDFSQVQKRLCFAPAIYNAIVEIHFATAVYETVKDRCYHLLLKVRRGTIRAKRQSRELEHPHETYKCRIDSVGCI